MDFKLHSNYEQKGDQVKAIREITNGLKKKSKGTNLAWCYWLRKNFYNG